LTKDDARASPALLLAAHGERRKGAVNQGLARLAATLRRCNVAREVASGLIKGRPTIAESIGAFAARDILVYPLFLSDGYFVRVRLRRSLEEARAEDADRTIRVLPPLGLDPLLAQLVTDRLAAAAQARGLAASQVGAVLLAHGSRNDAASRHAATQLAEKVRRSRRFDRVRAAFLEEPPSLCDVTSALPGPVVVLGLFAGDGMHGAADAPRLVAELGRHDVMFAGTVGNLPGIADLIAGAVARASGPPTERQGFGNQIRAGAFLPETIGVAS
jgi:sirohydrochlorin ferrochelatase